MIAERVICCRVCASLQLRPLPGLGDVPAFPRAGQSPDARAGRPAVGRVICTSCGTLQTDRAFPPMALYRDAYDLDRFGDPGGHASAELADRFTSRFQLRPADLVLEIGSNDGTLLREFHENGTRVLGLEPAALASAFAFHSGIGTIHGHFGPVLARYISRRVGRAQFVLSRNLLGVQPDVAGFLRAVGSVLDPAGFLVIQVRHAQSVFRELGGERVHPLSPCAFSLRGLAELAPSCGLTLADAEDGPHDSTSVFLTLRPVETNSAPTVRLRKALAWEAAAGLEAPETWHNFAVRWREACSAIRACMNDLAGQGLRVAGYSASADALALLDALQPDAKDLVAILDPNRPAHGKWSPVGGLPVVPVNAESVRADAVMVLDRTQVPLAVRGLSGPVPVRVFALFPEPHEIPNGTLLPAAA